jgi:hypothetical protein
MWQAVKMYQLFKRNALTLSRQSGYGAAANFADYSGATRNPLCGSML